MNAPATSQHFARPPLSGRAPPLPRHALETSVPLRLPVPSRDVQAPGTPPLVRERRRAVPRASALSEVVAGALLLVLWAFLWSAFLAGVVAPGGQLSAASPRPPTVTSAAGGALPAR
jgi:hypothetical protein